MIDAAQLADSFALNTRLIHMQTAGLTHADSLLQPHRPDRAAAPAGRDERQNGVARFETGKEITMSDLKTKPTDESVERFLEGITDEKQRQDCLSIVDLMRETTKAEPKLWGSSIVGFGSYRYEYASGRAGDWFAVGFSPRKQNLTLYLAGGYDGHDDLLNKLGKHKTGKSCLYIKRLKDIDLGVLKELIKQSVEHAAKPGA